MDLPRGCLSCHWPLHAKEREDGVAPHAAPQLLENPRYRFVQANLYYLMNIQGIRVEEPIISMALAAPVDKT